MLEIAKGRLAAALLSFLLMAGQAWAIEYAAGSRTNTTVTQVTGTRTEAVQLIEPVLTGVGWSVVSGSGTGDVVLQSGTTPQGFTARIRLYDSGAGNCFRIKSQNYDGTTTMSGDLFLQVAVGRVWRIVANAYQFFIFENGTNGTTARRFAFHTTPFVPTWNVASISNSAVLAMGDASTDTDTSPRSTLRTCLVGRGCQIASAHGYVWQLLSAGAIEGINANNVSAGVWRLVYSLSAGVSVLANPAGRRFLDNSYFVSDPWVAYEAAAFASEAKVVGMLWDGIVMMNGSLAVDSTFTFDGHTFIVITAPSTVGTNDAAVGQLCIRVS